MVAPRPPPKISRSPPPSSSASPPPPSTSAPPAQTMGKIVRIPRRDGPTTTTTTITTTTGNNASSGSATTRPGASTLRTISTTTAGGRQPIRRRPSPALASDAAAQTLEGANQPPAAPAGENSSRSGFVLRRDGPPVAQQPQPGAPAARPGWKRRRPIAADAPAATTPAASSGSQEAPEPKRLQADRSSGNGGAVPKPTPRAPVAPSTAASTPAPAVADQRSTPSAFAPAEVEGKASPTATSSDPSPTLPRLGRDREPSPTPTRQGRDREPSPTPPPQSRDRQPSPTLPPQGRDRDQSDRKTPPPMGSDPTVDPQGSKAVVSTSAVSDVIVKPVAAVEVLKPAETTTEMDVDPSQQSKGKGAADATEAEVSSGDNGQVIEFDVTEDAESSAFLAMLEKSAETMRSSSLWIGEALQSIRDDISKAAASDAGRARMGDLLRMSITDFFEPAVERTRAIGEAADGFADGVERYSAEGGEGNSDMAVAT